MELFADSKQRGAEVDSVTVQAEHVQRRMAGHPDVGRSVLTSNPSPVHPKLQSSWVTVTLKLHGTQQFALPSHALATWTERNPNGQSVALFPAVPWAVNGVTQKPDDAHDTLLSSLQHTLPAHEPLMLVVNAW